MPEGKHAGQRIKANLEFAQAQAEALRQQLLRAGASNRPFVSNDDSLDYALFRALEASDALTLVRHEYDEAIAKAFSEAKLDPENPWHWRVLLNVFADAYFPRRDSNQFWHYGRLTEVAAEDLRQEWLTDLAAGDPKKSRKKKQLREARIKRRKELTEWVAQRYGKRLAPSTVSKLLRQARDRKINKQLENTYQELVHDWTEILGKYKEKMSDFDGTIEALKNDPRTMKLTVALSASRLRLGGKVSKAHKK